MFDIIKYSYLWISHFKKGVKFDHAGNIDMVLELMSRFDKGSQKRLLKRFEKLPYAKTFFKQRCLRDEVMLNTYESGTLGKGLQAFWEQYPKRLHEDGIEIGTKKFGKKFNLTPKEKKFWEGIYMEHDLIHFLHGLSTGVAGEISNLSFTLAKSFRFSFFFIICITLLVMPPKMIGKTKRSFKKLKREVKEIHNIDWWVSDYIKCIFIAYKIGKRSPWILSINWHEYLNKPLNEVKKELGIDDFEFYHKKQKEIEKIKFWEEYETLTPKVQQHRIVQLLRKEGKIKY